MFLNIELSASEIKCMQSIFLYVFPLNTATRWYTEATFFFDDPTYFELPNEFSARQE